MFFPGAGQPVDGCCSNGPEGSANGEFSPDDPLHGVVLIDTLRSGGIVGVQGTPSRRRCRVRRGRP